MMPLPQRPADHLHHPRRLAAHQVPQQLAQLGSHLSHASTIQHLGTQSRRGMRRLRYATPGRARRTLYRLPGLTDLGLGDDFPAAAPEVLDLAGVLAAAVETDLTDLDGAGTLPVKP